MIRLLLLIFLSLHSITAVKADTSSAASLKTFFTTPDQRKKLDTLRNSGHFESSSKTTSITSRQVNLQGVIFSAHRKPVAFVNDKITTDRETANNRNYVRSANTESLNITLSTRNRNLRLKPGQSWNSHSNQPQENYSLPEKEVSTNPLSKLLNSSHDE